MRYNLAYIYPEMEALTRKESEVKRFLDRPLSFQSFENAYVLPSKDLWKHGKCYGGVVTAEGDFVESSAWHEGDRCDKYDFDPHTVQQSEATAIYMGFYNGCWGHAITDNLKKLWFLQTETCRQLVAQGAKLIYLTIDNKPQPQYVYRLFALAGVDLGALELVTELKQFHKIIIPDNSFVADRGQRYFTREYVATIDDIKNAAREYEAKAVHRERRSYPEKIYFTRTHLKSQRDLGEKEIEKQFQGLGYAVIAPEEYAVEEQVLFLMNCKAFATTEGSISHNVVFTPSGTEVTIIRKCNDVNKYQMAVNEVANSEVTYIDAHHSSRAPKEAPWAGPFYLYHNRNLSQWSGKKMGCWPFFLRPSYGWYLIQDHRMVKRIQAALRG